MVLACVAPLLLLFLLPAVGINEGVTLIIYFVLTCGAILLMTRRQSQEGEENNERGHKHN